MNYIDYLNKLVYQESFLQTKLRTKSETEGNAINIEKFEGKILQLFCALVDAENILEIGSLYGYSISFLLESLPPEGKLVAIEKNPDCAQYISENICDPRLKLITADALEISDKILVESPFDLIFIDANKASYQKYFILADEWLKPGGIMIFDNVLFRGEVYSESPGKLAGKIKEFNKFVVGVENYQSIILPSSDGLLVTRKIK